MSFTEEIDSFLKKHSAGRILDADEAKRICTKASDVLEVDLSLMSCLGDNWYVVDDDQWWASFNKIRLFLGNRERDSKLFVFFNGHPKHRVVRVELSKLLEMIDDNDFFHNIFAFDEHFKNAVFDDHSGLFCGSGYFSSAMQKYC